MKPPSDGMKVAAGATVTAIAVALTVALLQKGGPGPRSTYREISWPDGGGPTASTKCLLLSGLAAGPVLDLFELERGDAPGGAGYVQARICADPAAGTSPNVPQGMVPVPDTEEEIDYQPGWPQMAIWTEGAAFPCACRKDASCLITRPDAGTVTAPTGITLDEGTWSGAGCVPKVCVEIAGTSSWPEECPL